MQNQLLTILVCGGSCSGKSVFASLFTHATVLALDHFYLPKSKMKPDASGKYNYDVPESIDIAECANAAKILSEGKPATIPVYDMKISDRTGTQIITHSPDTKFVVVEGIFTFHSPLQELGDLKIFIDTPTEIRVARRMLRDQEKGRSDIDTLAWSVTVEKYHRLHVEPMKKYADLIIPFSYNPVQFAR